MFSRPARRMAAAAVALLATIALPTGSFAQVPSAQVTHLSSAAGTRPGISHAWHAQRASTTGPQDVAAPLILRATAQCRTAPLDPSGTGTTDCSASTNSVGCAGIHSCLLSITVNAGCPVPRRTLACGGGGGILGRSPFAISPFGATALHANGQVSGVGYYATPAAGFYPAYFDIRVTDTDSASGVGDTDTVTMTITPFFPFRASLANAPFPTTTATWTCTRPSQRCYVETLGPGAGTSG